MNILPLQSLIKEDSAAFAHLHSIAALHRLDFPSLPGVAIEPPLEEIRALLSRATDHSFEQNLDHYRKSFLTLPLPSELQHYADYEYYFHNGKIDTTLKELWKNLLEEWFNQTRSIIFREGLTKHSLARLPAISCFFVDKKLGQVLLKKGLSNCIATAYLDSEENDVVIKSALRPEPAVLKEICDLVVFGNKKLFLPKVYQFLLTPKPLCFSITPFTDQPRVKKPTISYSKEHPAKPLAKTVTKVYLDIGENLAFIKGVDGIVVDGQKIKKFDELTVRLVESAMSLPHLPVLFRLPHFFTSTEDSNGALFLIHHPKVLDSLSQAFLFARNKRDLLNLQLIVSLVRSPDEFEQLKRELASREISRKGTMKLWLEIMTPENVLNIERYCAVGLDGVVINLDSLMIHLRGVNPTENLHYSKDHKFVINFLEQCLKYLHRQRVPVILSGSLAMDSDILESMVEKGIGGVITSMGEAHSFKDHLSWLEKRVIHKKSL